MTPEEIKRTIELADLHKTSRVHSYHIQRQYGITAEQYTYQVEIQKGLCAICHNPPGKKRLSIDHDQKTGKNRGLLCTRCNVGLGYFMDNPEYLRSAIKYLENFNALVAPKLEVMKNPFLDSDKNPFKLDK